MSPLAAAATIDARVRSLSDIPATRLVIYPSPVDQILTRFMSAVQAFGQRLQAGELDNLCPPEVGTFDRGFPVVQAGIPTRSVHLARSDGRSYRRWLRCAASGKRRCCCARPGCRLGRCVDPGPDTRTSNRCGRFAEGMASRSSRSQAVGVMVHASGHLGWLGDDRSQRTRWPRIPCTIYVQRHYILRHYWEAAHNLFGSSSTFERCRDYRGNLEVLATISAVQ